MARVADRGYFPPGSVLRQVQGERIVGLLYGQRALLIGALHPLNYTGTIIASRGRRTPFQRLAHTAKVFEAIFFGTRVEADLALSRVAAQHAQIAGTLPAAAGPWPAGTPYSALDPVLMLWTVAVIADSAQALYETLVRQLSAAERERLWSDYVRFGELFGMPRAAVPATYAAFRAYWRERLASDDLHLTEHARRYAPRIAFDISVPSSGRPSLAVLNLLLTGSIPRDLRARFGLSWSPAHEVAFQALAAGMRRGRALVPRAVRRGRNDATFDLVARTERGRLRRGAATLQIDA